MKSFDISEAYQKFLEDCRAVSKAFSGTGFEFFEAGVNACQAENDKVIAELRNELEQQRFNNKHNLSIDQKVVDKIEELKQELAKERACVDYYANKENWFGVESYDGYFEGVACEDYNEGNPYPDSRHGGKRARERQTERKEIV